MLEEVVTWFALIVKC